MHAHGLNEWAGQPFNGIIMLNQVCVISCTLYLTNETSRTDQHEYFVLSV